MEKMVGTIVTLNVRYLLCEREERRERGGRERRGREREREGEREKRERGGRERERERGEGERGVSAYMTVHVTLSTMTPK